MGSRRKTQKRNHQYRLKITQTTSVTLETRDPLRSSDLEDRIERFEATYKATRQEYQGFSFRNDNDEEVAIPPEVARSIHAHCEFRAHPITANQKIQPNYVKSNVQNREPDKVGNLKVSAVGYYNRVQQQIGLPNYQRIKSMNIQKTRTFESIIDHIRGTIHLAYIISPV